MVDSRKIAKNTIVLYIRMLILMLTSLYTSRIILAALGVEDYGIYNVVGGIVVILGFLNGTLSTASSRFITVSLSTNNELEKQKTFSNILYINILLTIIIIIASESIGLWFLYNKMTIPPDRINAALWVYQISIATVVLSILSVPYNATIIAHEKMKAFTYISLFDAMGKLLLAFFLQRVFAYDRLIIYAFSIFLIQLIIRIIYGSYCRHNFKETRSLLFFDKKRLKDICYFISWSAYGSLVSVGFTQGLNILLNIFFGPTANAARGISVQVQNAVTQLSSNFQIAINPQLIRSVSCHHYEDAKKMMLAGSKISFLLLCFLGLPVIIEVQYILSIWLKVVPENSATFIQLMLTICIWGSLANPLRIVNQAEGNIKKFQLYECTALLLIVPLSYVSLIIWHQPAIVFVIHLLIELFAQGIRLKIVLPKIQMTWQDYTKQIYIRILPLFALPLVGGWIVKFFMTESFFRLCLTTFVIEFELLLLAYVIGLTSKEKLFLKSYISSKWKKY